jgi:hypothetical protein
MAKEWTDDEVQALISESVKIAKEDGIFKSVRDLHERLDRLFPPTGTTDEPTEGKPPPATDPKDSKDQAKKKRSLWWGEVE